MLALVIVYYNQPQQLKDFLYSLKKNSDLDFKLFIADLSNNLKLTQDFDFPIEIIAGKNKGYSYGINLCLKKAQNQKFEKYCVLNYDIYLDNKFIKNVKNRFKTHSIFGGKIYYARGFEYHKSRYQNNELGKVLWYGGGVINWDHATVTHLGIDQVDTGQFNIAKPTGFIPGTLMAFNIQVLKEVGFWDEKFFLYFEDTDYSIRALKKGYQLYFDPSIIIWHKNSAITDGPGSKLHIKQQAISRLRFGLKHAPWRTKIHLIINYLKNK